MRVSPIFSRRCRIHSAAAVCRADGWRYGGLKLSAIRLSVEQIIHVVGKAIVEAFSSKTQDGAKFEDLDMVMDILSERLTPGEFKELRRITGYGSPPIDPDEIPF